VLSVCRLAATAQQSVGDKPSAEIPTADRNRANPPKCLLRPPPKYAGGKKEEVSGRRGSFSCGDSLKERLATSGLQRVLGWV
jgi:hypothetical protein